MKSRCHQLICLLVLWMLFGGSGLGGAGESSVHKMVKVITKKEGDVTHFFVQNLEAGEVTASFTLGLDNLKASVKLPYTSTYPARQTTEAFTVSPINPKAGWGFTYTNQFVIGNHLAVHDDSSIYLLPYAAIEGFRVTQGYNGSYSHSGPDQYAIDFKMPAGTPVHAARGGVVVKVKNDSGIGGPSRKFEACANYVLIRHSDGTVANYAHLQKGSSTVKAGQTVEAGDRIALSGNTGFTSGPHLHFSVFKTRADGGGRESLPVKFATAGASGITLVEGSNYRPLRLGKQTDIGHLILAPSKEDRSLHATGAPEPN